jgi:guanine deaminase
MITNILKGSIAYASSLKEVTYIEDGYIVVENGCIQGVFEQLPERYAGIQVLDYREGIIVPSFSDFHFHAPQYPLLGLGMDLQLMDWLGTYCFKTECKFADPEYARIVYRALAEDLIRHGTTRVCMFSSLHREATIILMEELERVGVTGFVGKVNMDRNAVPYLQENREESIRETLRWLDECTKFSKVKPIITPRFIPSCTNELMQALGEIITKFDLPVQSHLSEDLGEVNWVHSLQPGFSDEWEIYNKFHMWKPKTVMAHCLYCSENERKAIKQSGVTMVHCPDSNTGVRAGVATVRKWLNEGLNITLGSDVAGGCKLSILDVAAEAIRVSKHRWMQTEGEEDYLSVGEAFYLATGAGQKYFDEKPGFHAGAKIHAVVLKNNFLPDICPTTVKERLERILYLNNKNSISAVYSEGEKVL